MIFSRLPVRSESGLGRKIFGVTKLSTIDDFELPDSYFRVMDAGLKRYKYAYSIIPHFGLRSVTKTTLMFVPLRSSPAGYESTIIPWVDFTLASLANCSPDSINHSFYVYVML